MTLTQLAYVAAVEAHGSFSRAADACHVTQPTLSMQVQKLERDLDVVLFDRSRTPVVATEAGRAVADQARRVLREAERVAEIAEAARGRVAGTLHLGVLPTLGPYLLPRFLPAFAARYPDVRLRVEELPTEVILDRLRHEALDAGLIATPEEAAGFHVRPLFDEPFVALVSAAHPLAGAAEIRPGALSREGLWVLSAAHCLRGQVLGLCAGAAGEVAEAGVRFESGNLETLVRLVEGGAGMTLLPVLAAPIAPGGAARRIPLAAPVPARRVALVQWRADLKAMLVAPFVTALLAALPPEVTGLPA